MSHPASPKLSLEPLLRATGCDRAIVTYDTRGGGWCPQGRLGYVATASCPAPQVALAERIGVSLRSVSRWAVDGIPIQAAEDAAFAFGLHPVNVWEDAWIFAAGCPLAKTVAAL